MKWAFIVDHLVKHIYIQPFNSLPPNIRQSNDIATFKSELKTYLFKKNDYELFFNPRKSVIIS